MGDNVLKVGGSRVFTIKFRAGPTREPQYLNEGAAGSVSWGQGDVTKIEAPSDTRYNQWNEIDSFQVSPDRATSSLQVLETDARSELYELVRIRCPYDVQLHIGCDADPRDFDLGWVKVKVMEDARTTSYDPPEQGSIGGDAQAGLMEDMPFSARDIYHILRMTYRTVAAAEVGEEVIAINVCDSISCAECGDGNPSDGCQRILAVTNSPGSSPGVLPQVIITTDQYGVTAIIERWITTFVIGENASDAACVGSYYVVASSDGDELHFASIADMVISNETWTGVATGIVAGNGPTSIWNYSPLLSFIGGLNGYIYQMKNPADGVTVLDAGIATADNINDIDGYDPENVAAVGDAGAFVYATDGSNFNAGVAPVGPTDLYAIAYRNKKEIWVGGDDGVLYVTTDFGVTWTTKTPPGTITQIDKIVWANETVGFVAGRVAGPLGRVLRTINGGYSWYVVPESVGMSLPVVDYLNDLAVCEKEPNKLFAGGLADAAADGVIIKGSDS